MIFVGRQFSPQQSRGTVYRAVAPQREVTRAGWSVSKEGAFSSELPSSLNQKPQEVTVWP